MRLQVADKIPRAGAGGLGGIEAPLENPPRGAQVLFPERAGPGEPVDSVPGRNEGCRDLLAGLDQQPRGCDFSLCLLREEFA